MTHVLEPHGHETYAVRDSAGVLVGYVGYAGVHRAWHAFGKDGEFLGQSTSRTAAAELAIQEV